MSSGKSLSADLTQTQGEKSLNNCSTLANGHSYKSGCPDVSSGSLLLSDFFNNGSRFPPRLLFWLLLCSHSPGKPWPSFQNQKDMLSSALSKSGKAKRHHTAFSSPRKRGKKILSKVLGTNTQCTGFSLSVCVISWCVQNVHNIWLNEEKQLSLQFFKWFLS